MGMDLIGTSYVTIVSGSPMPSDAEAVSALRRTVFSLPEETLIEAANYWNFDDVDDESGGISDALLDQALSGWQDVADAILSGHRFHTVVAETSEFYISWAGGGSWGDDPYDGWTDLCVFLWIVRQAPYLVPIFGVDADVSKYLKDLKDVA